MLYDVLPTVLAQSFNIDLTAVMDYASSMFNALMPIAAVGIGLSLGVGIIAMLIRIIRGAIGGIG